MQRFFHNPFYGRTIYRQPGYGADSDTIKGSDDFDGEMDKYPEAAFMNVGTIEEAIEKGKTD